MVDLSSGDSSYIEDCQVCCRPIEVEVSVTDMEEGTFEIEVGTSDS